MSPDPQEASDRFREKLELPFPLVGDAEGAVTRAFKVRWPLLGGARRCTFVVDGERAVRLAYANEIDPEAHVKKAAQALDALRAT